jgi:anaerobic magnesium-protoporphyrin IX monomethyl ester cyclase
MKVLMLIPPYIKGFMRNARWDGMTISGTNWYPIFMAYCTGLLEKKGHTVKLVDAQVDRLTREQVYVIAREFEPELTVTYFSMKCLLNDIEISQSICELTHSDCVFVGHNALTEPEYVVSISPKVTKLIKGEFDYGVLDLINKVPFKDIGGLVWKDKDGIHDNGLRPILTTEQITDFPFVTDVYKRHLTIKNYWLSGHLNPYVDMFTGRGCNWGVCQFCNWCANMYGGIGNKYRYRPIKDVIEELRFVKSDMPYVKDVYFQDDNMPEFRAVELSEAILDAKIKMRWSSYSRAELNYDTLKLMNDSGCYMLETGFESSSQKILDNIHKGITVRQMEQYAYDAQHAGITVIGAFITGLPGETVETIKNTTEWISKLPILRYTITLPKPFKGTEFYSYLEKNGYLKDGHPNYPELSSEDIYKWNKWMLKKSYLNTRFIRKMIVRPQDWMRVVKSAYYFIPYLFNKEKESNVELEW